MPMPALPVTDTSAKQQQLQNQARTEAGGVVLSDATKAKATLDEN